MAPSIQFRMPPGWFFKFPPDDQPPALPPPTEARTFASPFPIRPDIYNNALDYKVPITIATVYAVTVILWNKINRDRGFKPYGFSKSLSFKAFVILHNVFLAVFSAFTFVGMIRALAHTWPGREHHLLGKFWPGLRTSNGVVGAADALCKIHGPRGFGNFVSFNPDLNAWEAKDKLVQLTSAGLPDPSDVGRLWNEGLAFWGWWFYLSKFYEVFDTFIILAKGKRSSTLQTYHHTGAMMCMWAGIRYMSPPIWMFCFLNSGIHTLMYIYYTLSALSIKVPQRVKRTLTTMQILQFLIGITFAGMHLFVVYRIPVTKSEAVSKTLDAIASSVVGGLSSAAATATNTGIAAWLKQAALRAAGEEGLAENVLGQPAQAPLEGSRSDSSPPQPRYISGWETVPCIDTSGQAFAVWLNLLYLAPLTGLFVRFFIRSYIGRGAASRHPTKKRRFSKSIQDAAHGTNRELDTLGKSAEDNVGGGVARQMNGNGKLANGKAHRNNNTNNTPRSRKVSDTITRQIQRFEKGSEEQLSDTAKTPKSSLRKKASEGHDKLRRMFEDGSVSQRSESPAQERSQTSSDSSSSTVVMKESTGETIDKLEDEAEASVRKAKDAAGISLQENASSESIREEEESPSPSPTKGKGPEQESEKKVDDMEQSTDAYQRREKEQQEQQATASAEQLPSQEKQQEERSSTPTLHLTKSLSPQKSKLPRPSSQASRSRSPAKKASGSSEKKNSSIPLPSNGTKQQPSTTSSNTSGREEKDKPSTSTPTLSVEQKEEKEEESKESATSHSTPSSSPEGQQKAEGDQSTNGENEQVSPSAAGADSSSKTEVESGKDSESALQWRHVDNEETHGGGAERVEGLSFAEAVKEGLDDAGADAKADTEDGDRGKAEGGERG